MSFYFKIENHFNKEWLFKFQDEISIRKKVKDG